MTDVLLVKHVGGRAARPLPFGLLTNTALGMLSMCVPCGHPWPIDAEAKLMCFKERMGMRLLVFVVSHSK